MYMQQLYKTSANPSHQDSNVITATAMGGLLNQSSNIQLNLQSTHTNNQIQQMILDQYDLDGSTPSHNMASKQMMYRPKSAIPYNISLEIRSKSALNNSTDMRKQLQQQNQSILYQNQYLKQGAFNQQLKNLFVKQAPKEIIDIHLPAFQSKIQCITNALTGPNINATQGLNISGSALNNNLGNSFQVTTLLNNNPAEETQQSLLYTIQKAQQEQNNSFFLQRGMLSNTFSSKNNINDSSPEQQLQPKVALIDESRVIKQKTFVNSKLHSNTSQLTSAKFNKSTSRQQPQIQAKNNTNSINNSQNMHIRNSYEHGGIVEYSCIPIRDGNQDIFENEGQNSQRNNSNEAAFRQSKSQNSNRFNLKEALETSIGILPSAGAGATAKKSKSKKSKEGNSISSKYGGKSKKSQDITESVVHATLNKGQTHIPNDYQTPLSNNYQNQIMHGKLQKQLMNCAQNFHIINKRFAQRLGSQSPDFALAQQNLKDEQKSQLLKQIEETNKNLENVMDGSTFGDCIINLTQTDRKYLDYFKPQFYRSNSISSQNQNQNNAIPMSRCHRNSIRQVTRNSVGLDPKSKTSFAKSGQNNSNQLMTLNLNERSQDHFNENLELSHDVKVIQLDVKYKEKDTTNQEINSSEYKNNLKSFIDSKKSIVQKDKSFQKANQENHERSTKGIYEEAISPKNLSTIRKNVEGLQSHEQMMPVLTEENQRSHYKTEQTNRQMIVNAKSQHISSEISMHGLHHNNIQPLVNINYLRRIHLESQKDQINESPLGNSKGKFGKKGKQIEQRQVLQSQYQLCEGQFQDQKQVRIRKQTSSLAAKKLQMSRYSQQSQSIIKEERAKNIKHSKDKIQRLYNFKNEFPLKELQYSKVQSIQHYPLLDGKQQFLLQQQMMLNNNSQLLEQINESPQVDINKNQVQRPITEMRIKENLNKSQISEKLPQLNQEQEQYFDYLNQELKAQQIQFNQYSNDAFTEQIKSSQDRQGGQGYYSQNNSIYQAQSSDFNGGSDLKSSTRVQDPRYNQKIQMKVQLNREGLRSVQGHRNIIKGEKSLDESTNKSKKTNLRQIRPSTQMSLEQQEEHRSLITSLKAQLLEDDLELFDLLKICGGFKFDQQKMNRLLLDRIKYGSGYRQGRVLISKKIGSDSSGFNNTEFEKEIRRRLEELDKEIVYSKIDLQQQQLQINQKNSSMRTSQLAEIPGKLPMSEMISGVGSQREFNNDHESINEYESNISKTPFKNMQQPPSIVSQNAVGEFTLIDQKLQVRRYSNIKIQDEQSQLQVKVQRQISTPIDLDELERQNPDALNYQRIMNQRKNYQQSPLIKRKMSKTPSVIGKATSNLSQMKDTHEASFESINIDQLKNNKLLNSHLKNQNQSLLMNQQQYQVDSFTMNTTANNQTQNRDIDYVSQFGNESSIQNAQRSNFKENFYQKRKRPQQSSLMTRKRNDGFQRGDQLANESLLIMGNKNILIKKQEKYKTKTYNNQNTSFNGGTYESLWNSKGNFDISAVTLT
ncbi:UNKNOWN [Stylonychia lemnae]|uniref:Uncharacterized protein n=1 Tax=Stylonychia lemnae TaxID=5949 RepID=A0A078AL99_STYLE|nr:UNKNOWN [Stylonychia lemnae]|eukprot:CDW82187.1 UNKNOWN [Stylonychia lemnae]